LEAHFIQDFIEVLFASAGLNDFGLSASDIKAYVLNRHLKTLAGIIFDSPAKQGLNLFLNSQRSGPAYSFCVQADW